MTCDCNPTLILASASPWTCPHGNVWRLGVPGDPYCWTREPAYEGFPSTADNRNAQEAEKVPRFRPGDPCVPCGKRWPCDGWRQGDIRHTPVLSW